MQLASLYLAWKMVLCEMAEGFFMETVFCYVKLMRQMMKEIVGRETSMALMLIMTTAITILLCNRKQ